VKSLFIFSIAILLFSSSCVEKSRISFVNSSLDSTIIATKISFKNLVKNYKSLHGQYIVTEGYAFWGFETSALCRKDDFWSKSNEQSCFWLNFNKNLHPNDSLLLFASGRKFILKGKVDTTDRGHLGFYTAALSDIYYLKVK